MSLLLVPLPQLFAVAVVAVLLRAAVPRRRRRQIPALPVPRCK